MRSNLRTAGLAAVSLLLVAALAGCPTSAGGGNPNNGNSAGGDSSQTPPPNLGAEVTIKNHAFSPRSVTIKVGQAVRWTNQDLALHTATSGNPGDKDAGAAFDSQGIARNREFVHTFDQAGEFVYFCIPHQFMASMRDATVIVEPADVP